MTQGLAGERGMLSLRTRLAAVTPTGVPSGIIEKRSGP